MSVLFCNHIHLLCNDLDAMIEFWSKGFGVKLDGKRVNAAGIPGAIMDMGFSAKLFLKQTPCDRADVGNSRAGVEHFGFLVPDLEKAMANALQLSTVSVDKPPFMAGSRLCCFLKGPEGIMVELMQDVPA